MHDKQAMCEAKLRGIIEWLSAVLLPRLLQRKYFVSIYMHAEAKMWLEMHMKCNEMTIYHLNNWAAIFYVSYEYCDIIVQRGKALHSGKRGRKCTRVVGEDG